MSENAPGSSSGMPSTKAIASLARKQGDVTRQGTQKLKFVPTLPARRKKDEVKPESSSPLPPSKNLGSGISHDKGRGDSRGRGRGAARPQLEMTASGPFAMGPALAGNTARRSIPRSNFAPTPTSTSVSTLGSGLVRGSAPSIKADKKGKTIQDDNDNDVEVYSDPDEGVEIVDMEDVRRMDWMAPETLKKERAHKTIKKEESTQSDVPFEVDEANAFDISESEGEEELEDIIEHFTAANVAEQDAHEERLYFFQFPSPFSTFVSSLSSATALDSEPSASTVAPEAVPPSENVKVEPRMPKTQATEQQMVQPKVDGIIGKLEIYRSGAVKMRLENGILLDVTAATPQSFLQQAVCYDEERKRLIVLGEINKRFAVSPNVETLLSAMEKADKKTKLPLDGEDLIQMDTM